MEGGTIVKGTLYTLGYLSTVDLEKEGFLWIKFCRQAGICLNLASESFHLKHVRKYVYQVQCVKTVYIL